MPADPDFDVVTSKAPERRFSFLRVFALLGGLLLLVALLIPATRSAGPAARRSQCVNNLKQIALALHNYASAYDALPPAYTVDANGRPLHSWRTLILPFLEMPNLYRSIDLTKPWNDPANAAAMKTNVLPYICPGSTVGSQTTTYLAVVGPNFALKPTEPRRLDEITDGTSNTIMVIEVGDESAVHWMCPADAGEPLVMGLGPETKLQHAGGMNAAFVDGSVNFLKSSLRPEARRAIMSVAGHDTPNRDDW